MQLCILCSNAFLKLCLASYFFIAHNLPLVSPFPGRPFLTQSYGLKPLLGACITCACLSHNFNDCDLIIWI